MDIDRKPIARIIDRIQTGVKVFSAFVIDDDKIHYVQAHPLHWNEKPDVFVAAFQGRFDIEAAAQTQRCFAKEMVFIDQAS